VRHIYRVEKNIELFKNLDPPYCRLFSRFGLMVHIGRGPASSKAECLSFKGQLAPWVTVNLERRVRGQQACLVCPEANEKECKNCKLIKKAETKNHHQIILGNHEFSGKRLEEKSEKGKRYHRKCEREFQKFEINFHPQIESGKGEAAGKRESRKGGKEIIHFAATTSLTPREKE
jgi:hypothetical protein